MAEKKDDSKAPKMTPERLKEIQKLFKKGLEAAIADPKKFWDIENEKADRTPPSKFLANQKLIPKDYKAPKKGKQEGLVRELGTLLADPPKKS